MRILLCEDDENLGMLLREYLQAKGYDTVLCSDGEEGYREFLRSKYNLCVFDVMMPKKDGFTLAKEIRMTNSEVPIVFLTAKTLKEDVFEGFKIGADDYLTKPFSMEEVMIRLHRLVQRSGVAAIDDAELVVGDLVLNQDTREVTRGGEQINLTATQFDLLRYLMENAKRVVSKSQILDNVWNYDFGGQANIVELYISYLRKKIDVGREPMIHTVRGAGYVLRPAV